MRLTVEMGFSDFDRIKLNGRTRIKLNTTKHPISHIRDESCKEKRVPEYQYIECTIDIEELYAMASAGSRGDVYTQIELHDCKEVQK